MALTPNQSELINELESATLVGNRYERLHCVNVNGSGDRRGVLSLVFQGYDRLDNNYVAIKVMDPDRLSDKYRLAAFEREPEILECVEGRARCLQLRNGFQHYTWTVNVTGVTDPLEFKCGYFVTEWLEEDIDSFFFEQDSFSAEEKLRLFRNIVLGLEAIHQEAVFHRDLKIDNIRLRSESTNQVAVIIDFGTAARADTPHIGSTYDSPVGAPAYAPPEAFVGFSGTRELAHLADCYALGVLLFDLFNIREFRFARGNDTEFRRIVAAGASSIATEPNEDKKLNLWISHCKKFRHIPTSPVIASPGNSIPPSIAPITESIYRSLIDFDINNRTSELSEIRHRLDTALKVLNNHRLDAEILRRKRERRQKRQQKLIEKQQRLEDYLSTRKIGHVER